ncbi:hypothetical protein ABG067_007747 [Albugo candida]
MSVRTGISVEELKIELDGEIRAPRRAVSAFTAFKFVPPASSKKLEKGEYAKLKAAEYKNLTEEKKKKLVEEAKEAQKPVVLASERREKVNDLIERFQYQCQDLDVSMYTVCVYKVTEKRKNKYVNVDVFSDVWLKELFLTILANGSQLKEMLAKHDVKTKLLEICGCKAGDRPKRVDHDLNSRLQRVPWSLINDNSGTLTVKNWPEGVNIGEIKEIEQALKVNARVRNPVPYKGEPTVQENELICFSGVPKKKRSTVSTRIPPAPVANTSGANFTNELLELMFRNMDPTILQSVANRFASSNSN